jgi:hypothetical protein
MILALLIYFKRPLVLRGLDLALKGIYTKPKKGLFGL